MKRQYILPVCLVVVVLVGCSSDPTVRWAAAREGLTQVEKGLVTAHANGWIDDADLVATDPYVKGTRAALARAGDLVASTQPTGGPPEGWREKLDAYLDLAEATIRDLQRLVASRPNNPRGP